MEWSSFACAVYFIVGLGLTLAGCRHLLTRGFPDGKPGGPVLVGCLRNPQ